MGKPGGSNSTWGSRLGVLEVTLPQQRRGRQHPPPDDGSMGRTRRLCKQHSRNYLGEARRASHAARGMSQWIEM
jgi:hypothetical protein